MPRKETQEVKRPFDAIRPFPRRCGHCGKDEVVMITTDYSAETRHDGRLYRFVVPSLQIPACRACGEKVFTEDVNRQIAKTCCGCIWDLAG